MLGSSADSANMGRIGYLSCCWTGGFYPLQSMISYKRYSEPLSMEFVIFGWFYDFIYDFFGTF